MFNQTLAFGAAPQGNLGGIDPIQKGLGVRPAGIVRDFSQGQLESTGIASDLAIEGDGFFQLRNENGSPVYTRDGTFSLNPSNYLHNPTNGYIVQGYQASFETFNVIPTDNAVTNINVPIGELSIARATTEAQFIGNLNGSGDIADSGSVLESEVFRDSGGSIATLNSSLIGLQREGPNNQLIDLGISQGSIIELDVEKGNRAIATKTFAVSSNPVPGADAYGTTMAELIEFMEDGMGVNDVSDYSYSAVASRSNGTGTVFATGNVQTGETINTAGTMYTALDTVDFRALGVEEGDFIRFTDGTAAGQTAQITFIDSTATGSNNILHFTPLDQDVSFPTATEQSQWSIHERANVALGATASDTGTILTANGDVVAAGSFTSPLEAFANVDVGDVIRFDTGTNVVSAVIATVAAGSLTFTANSNIPAGFLASINQDGVSWDIDGTAYESELDLTGIDTLTTTQLTRAGVDWVAKGVAVGDTIRFENSGTPILATVDSITGGTNDTLVFSAPLTTIPADLTDFRIDGRIDSHSQGGTIRIAGNVGEANGITNLSLKVQNGVQLSTFQQLSEAAGESTVATALVYDSRGEGHLAELTLALVSKSDAGVRYQWFAEAEDDVDVDRVVGTTSTSTDSSFGTIRSPRCRSN
jgi:flagellar hook-basal body protein